MALTPEESLLAMDSFIRERVEHQVKICMKDDRLVASEVTDKVLKNLKYTFFPMFACIALFGWLGYSNLRQAVKPITDEAKRQANNALELAKQAKSTSSDAAERASSAKSLANQNAEQVKRFAEGTQQQLDLAKKHLGETQSSVASTTKSINAKFAFLDETAALFDAQLKAKADQLKSYESRISALGTQVARISAEKQFPGLGKPFIATVGQEIISARGKKAGEKYLVFDLTQWAVNAGTMKAEDVVHFEADLQAKGFRVFGGTAAFGNASGSQFEVGPFKRGTFHSGVWVLYFRPEQESNAREVYSQLSKYLKMSAPEPQFASEKEYGPESQASRFIDFSGVDVYVQVFPENWH
jgi:hypothetical protein